jgi:hypothetical protein
MLPLVTAAGWVHQAFAFGAARPAAPSASQGTNAGETTMGENEGAATAAQGGASPSIDLPKGYRWKDLGQCPCTLDGCKGELKPVISDDGSAFLAEQCDTCGTSWFNDPPKLASEAYESDLPKKAAPFRPSTNDEIDERVPFGDVQQLIDAVSGPDARTPSVVGLAGIWSELRMLRFALVERNQLLAESNARFARDDFRRDRIMELAPHLDAYEKALRGEVTDATEAASRMEDADHAARTVANKLIAMMRFEAGK